MRGNISSRAWRLTRHLKCICGQCCYCSRRYKGLSTSTVCHISKDSQCKDHPCDDVMSLQAAILTGRRGKTAMSLSEVDDSVDRIVAGMEGTPMVDSKSKALVAYHEVGHAICGHPHTWCVVPPDSLVSLDCMARSLCCLLNQAICGGHLHRAEWQPRMTLTSQNGLSNCFSLAGWIILAPKGLNTLLILSSPAYQIIPSGTG